MERRLPRASFRGPVGCIRWAVRSRPPLLVRGSRRGRGGTGQACPVPESFLAPTRGEHLVATRQARKIASSARAIRRLDSFHSCRSLLERHCLVDDVCRAHGPSCRKPCPCVRVRRIVGPPCSVMPGGG